MHAGKLIIALLLALSMATVFAGCSDKKAAEIYETAKFEELQDNREHAIKLYERIIAVYPSTEYAVKAKDRIEALKKQKK